MIKKFAKCSQNQELLIALTKPKSSIICTKREFHSEPNTYSVPLSDLCGDQIANDIRNDLTENESVQNLKGHSEKPRKHRGVSKIWSNFLASNTPLEDRRVGTQNFIKVPSHRSRYKVEDEVESVLFGVLDGHGSGYCADAISRRISDYFVTSQISKSEIERYLRSSNLQVNNDTFRSVRLPYRSRNLFNDRNLTDRTYGYLRASALWPIWRRSNLRFSQKILDGSLRVSNIQQCIRTALTELDKDLMREAALKQPEVTSEQAKVLRNIALSGAVGTFCVAKQGMLTVAHVGDTRAVIGRKNEAGEWVSEKITVEHNTENIDEYERLISEHPGEDKDNIVCCNRVLGVLQPTRAYGDTRLKQSAEWIEENLLMPPYPDYNSPPYITVEPYIKSIPLTKDLKFCVVASDGFWDRYEESLAIPDDGVRAKLSQEYVIKEIGAHIDYLEAWENQPYNRNALSRYHQNLATNILKNSLMMNEFGEMTKCNLVELLTLPHDERRSRRDDITVTVVTFD